MTRFAVAAAAFLALFVVVANEASALTATTRQCISRERRASRDALRAARAAEQSALNQKVASCFGPGAACAQNCQRTQAACQAPFKAAQQRCIDDGDDANFTSCSDTFDAALLVCNDIQDDGQALQCAANARLARFACTQTCATAQAAGLDSCNFLYGDCIQACASQPLAR